MTTIPSSIRRWAPRMLLGIGLAAILALAVAIILVAIPFTRRCLILAAAQWMLGGRLESLAVDLDIQPNLRWVFTLLVMLPVGFGLARMVFARRVSNAAVGLALAAGTLLGLAVLVWWQTRHCNFDAKGRPVVYLSFRRDGVHKSYSPGIDRLTGRPKYQATVDRVQWLSALAQLPVRQVDPGAETNWFDANSGEPNLWYVETGAGQWQFFNRPHFHQQLRLEVSPITPELMARWQTERDRRAAAAELLRLKQEADARAAAEKQAREERDRAERERQADLLIRAEAEALAKLESERRERAEQLAREEQRRRETAAAAEQVLRLAQQRDQPAAQFQRPASISTGFPQTFAPQTPAQRLQSVSASSFQADSTGISSPVGMRSPVSHYLPPATLVPRPASPPSPRPLIRNRYQFGKNSAPTASARAGRPPASAAKSKPSILRPAGTVLASPFRIAGSLLVAPIKGTSARITTAPVDPPPPGPLFWRPSGPLYLYPTAPAAPARAVPPGPNRVYYSPAAPAPAKPLNAPYASGPNIVYNSVTAAGPAKAPSIQIQPCAYPARR